MKTYYRRNLPHIQPIGATFFVTFRLKGSLPSHFMSNLTEEYEAKIAEILSCDGLDHEAEMYRQQKIFFKRYDEGLDLVHDGVDYLRRLEVAQVVAEKIHEYDGELYELLAYCIMPNHVHLVFDTSVQLRLGDIEIENINEENYKQLDRIMKLIKGGGGFEANKILGRRGDFFQRESYDHYVRDEKELARIIWYVVNNPVKARFVKTWGDFEYTYWKDGVVT